MGTVTAIRQPARYISMTDTAKLVRAALKREYPTVKFSVVSGRGSVISVRWQDGPTTRMVERLTAKYGGADFDGMIDLKSYHDSDLNGERVHFGADWVSCSRNFSRGLLEQVIAEAKRRYGVVVTINSYGGFECTAGYSEETWFRTLLYNAYCDQSGRVVAYVEVK